MTNHNPAPFQFQQFTVRQTRAAMKVGFDGVLLGAWVDVEDCDCVLDVGTGTGLVALMLAQRSNSATLVHAIDVDAEAVADAEENFQASRWSSRLSVERVTLQDFAANSGDRFERIVCNPPFYQGPACPQTSRHTARHATCLPLTDLLLGSDRLLQPGGKLAMIVPQRREVELRTEAQRQGWHPVRELRVRPLEGKPVHRVLVELSRSREPLQLDELAIEMAHHDYSSDFRRLTRDFYLAH